ncbi:MAG TPA: integrase core domain-containing protein, partial [Gemmatimonadales bacterium]
MPARVSTGENNAPYQGTHNIFIERLWRSLKYQEVFIKAYGSVVEARRGIGGWLSFYNEER